MLLAGDCGGYLVAIGDVTEEQWLYSYFGADLFWIGPTDKAVEDMCQEVRGSRVSRPGRRNRSWGSSVADLA